MKQTLQDQYLLIKEGKGHKGVFLADAKRQFPNIVRNAATFEEASSCLKTKNIISENVIGLTAVNSPFEPKKKESYELAFENFLAEAKKKQEEDEKAELKATSKQVEKDLEHNFDYKDDKNYETLCYGRVIILTDSDVDGYHICGLLLNFFHKLFPSLLERELSFVTCMRTPIVRIYYSNPKKLPGNLPAKRKTGVVYRKNNCTLFL